MKLSQIEMDTLLAMSRDEKWDFVCKESVDEKQSGEIALLLGSDPMESIHRAKAAARLYGEGRVNYVLASGGVQWDYQGHPVSEAHLMRCVLMEHGVPESAILLDLESRSTRENMLCSALVMSRRLKLKNIRKIVLVTSQFHTKRSLALAKALLPRRFEFSVCPYIPEETKEEWLQNEENQKRLNSSVRLLKTLVDHGEIEDMYIE